MTLLIVVLTTILVLTIILQIAKVTELARHLRGAEEAKEGVNQRNASMWMIFLIGFLGLTTWSALYYKNYMLGYGPHTAASELGVKIDSLFNVTLFFTGIVFVLTHIALCWFSYKYQERKNVPANFFAHSTKLELIWTIIPAIVMTYLVIGGLDAWNEIMADTDKTEIPGQDYIEIEATGYQFAWAIRYPGPDQNLGRKNYKLINESNNPLGIDWSDEESHDDWVSTGAGEVFKLPVGKKVRVRITARDVLHNFYLAHFRVKMDAVPGMPTYFVFTPTMTTEDYRKSLSQYPEYQVPADPAVPNGPQKWETFQYELACAELCGRGHYSMRRILEVVSQEDYDKWLLTETNSYYKDNIMGTDDDPYQEENLSLLKEAKKVIEEAAVEETKVEEVTVPAVEEELAPETEESK